MADDFKTESTRRRLQQLDLLRQQQIANLAISEAEGDYDDAQSEITKIAVIDAEKAAIEALYARHAAANQPPPPQRPDAWLSKRTDEMGHEDVYQMLHQTSENAKLGGGISREEYLANIHRLQREKAAGYRQN
jgi:hypothetical protein